MALWLPFLIILPPLIYALLTLWCGRRFFCRSHALPGYHPPVTILKPVKGMDAESFENFASFCLQDYPSAWQIVFAAASETDPVIPVIRSLKSAFPGHDIELVIDGSAHGPNYKVCNLINAYPKAKHDIIIVCDSDIRVGSDYLKQITPLFADQAVGLVTSLYRSPRVRGAATALEAIGFSAEMVPNVMAAFSLEGLSFALGASMAVRREALEKIGGFQTLVDYLADDYQLGNKVYRAGYRIELSPGIVESVMHNERLSTVLSRQLRWARTMRASRPGGYLGLGLTQPFPAAFLVLVVYGPSATAIAAVACLYAVRATVAAVFSRCYLKDLLLPRWLWLLPFRDALAFGTWLLSFAGNRVRWRGHSYRLLPGGMMEEISR